MGPPEGNAADQLPGPVATSPAESCPTKVLTASRSEATQAAERIRIQELLRYFQPYDAPEVGTAKARIATDSTLTAFAQLCALRLNCDRAFISLMDQNSQYIIAEATRTVSIKSEDVYDNDDDAIYLGQTILDFEWGVCPGTIACFTSPDDSLNVSTEYIEASRAHYVMNDMSKLEDFKDRPYIAGWPYMKYYAEVPIHSPTGLTIGTLCVVDNKPRPGLDKKGLAVLEEVSEAVMNHLELCVNKIQRNNAERMIHALGGFVQGNDSIRGQWKEAQASRAEQLDSSEQLRPDGNNPLERMSAYNITQKESPVADVPNSSTDTTDTSPRLSALTGDSAFSRPKLSQTDNDKDPESSAESVVRSSTMENLESLLNRAMNLIREGIGLDGTMLLDPRSEDGMLLDASPSLKRSIRQDSAQYQSNKAGHLASAEEDDKQTGLNHSASAHAKQSCCKVLGYAFKQNSPRPHAPRIPEQTLQYLLRDFPNGGVLHFDQQGLIGQNDSVFNWRDPMSFSSSAGHSIIVPEDKSGANNLRNALPAATCIMLFPLRKSVENKLIGYCLGWTTNPHRIFQREDFAYLASFANSITAEISRLDAIASDKAKAGFISSISHELRSPLHGIMASVEMLHEQDLGNDADTIRTIESCGTALLETMDNLLMFAKVQKPATQLVEPEILNPQDVVNLAVLVEDVIQICIASQSFKTSSGESPSRQELVSSANGSGRQARSRKKLLIVSDVDHTVDWNIKTDTGVWKRVLLNLLGNAIKYTQSGHILVTLRRGYELFSSSSEANSRPRSASPNAHHENSWPSRSYSKGSTSHSLDEQQLRIRLTVTDTGKGISQEYMAHHMFKPFFQEDSMSPGTGLGLSLVGQLVASIHGTINVSSKVGAGTVVTVEVDVPRVASSAASASTMSTPCSIGFYRPPQAAVSGLGDAVSGVSSVYSELPMSVLSSYAAHLNLPWSMVTSTRNCDVDIIVISEDDVEGLDISAINASVIVLPSEPLLYAKTTPRFAPAVVLSQPFGLKAFQDAIGIALSRRNEAPMPRENNNDNDKQLGLPRVPPQPLQELTPSAKRLPKVLLVEDNSINLKLLVMSMKKLNYPHSTACDGSQAVASYCANAFDIVVMDIQMPVMDGLQATAAIREYERHKGLKPAFIIALTALISRESRQAAVDAGADEYLSKPVSMKKLRDIIDAGSSR